MNTSLDTLFELQAGLMRALGVDLDGDAQRPGISEMSVEAATGLVCEAAEVLEAITKMHRAWKPNTSTDVQVAHAKEEAIDALFYLTEMFISLGITSGEQLMELVHRKRAIVLARVVKAAYAKGGEALTTREFGLALAEVRRYAPMALKEPFVFHQNPVTFVEMYFDLDAYLANKELG